MPELPDLTLFAHNLKKQILGRPIGVATADKPAKCNVPPAVFAQTLMGASIADISREGKELYFHLSNNKIFAIHLMLKGAFQLLSAQEIVQTRSRILSLTFEDGGALCVTDVLGMCRVTLAPRRGTAPDALSREFAYDYFQGQMRRFVGRNVKELLIDQKVIRGIGNAYADEILYAADISPLSYVGRIPEAGVQALYEAIGSTLTAAVEQLFALTPDAISGEERSFLRVHNSALTRTAEGYEIKTQSIAQKKTYYVREQKLYM